MSTASSSSSSYEDDPTYLPYRQPESSVLPSRSRRPSTAAAAGGGGGGDNQSGQPPYLLPSSAKRKRTQTNLLDPSPKPTTSRQRDPNLASLTHDDTGKSHQANAATGKEIGYSLMDPDLALIHRSVINKYGDIGRYCPFENSQLRTYMLESIYKVILELKGKTLKTLDENSLANYELLLRDAEVAKFDVKWLRQRLHELRDAFKSFTETTQAKNEKIKHMEDIDILVKNIENLKLVVDEKRKEVERLSSEICRSEPGHMYFEEISLLEGLL